MAEGHVREIRDLIDKHPHRIVLKSDNDRALAAKLVGYDDVVGVELRPEGGIMVETRRPTRFTAACRRSRSRTARRSKKSIPTTTTSKPSSSTW